MVALEKIQIFNIVIDGAIYYTNTKFNCNAFSKENSGDIMSDYNKHEVGIPSK